MALANAPLSGCGARVSDVKAHGLLLHRHASGIGQRRHDGKIAVDRSNLRWCSDGFELACDRKREQAITTPRPLSLPKLILTS
jgi:hypothetical protein